MNLSNKEKYIKQVLNQEENHSVNTDEMWDAIQGRIPTERRRRPLVWLWLSLGCVVGGLTTWYMLGRENTSEIVAKNVVNKTTKPVELQAEVLNSDVDQNIDIEKEDKASLSRNTASIKEINQQLKRRKAYQQINDIRLQPMPTFTSQNRGLEWANQTEQNNVVGKKAETKNVITNNASNVVLPSILSAVNPLSWNAINPLDLEQPMLSLSVQKQQSNHRKINLHYAAFISSHMSQLDIQNTLTQPTSHLTNTDFAYETALPAYGVTVGMSAITENGWSLNMGVGISNYAKVYERRDNVTIPSEKDGLEIYTLTDGQQFESSGEWNGYQDYQYNVKYHGVHTIGAISLDLQKSVRLTPRIEMLAAVGARVPLFAQHRGYQLVDEPIVFLKSTQHYRLPNPQLQARVGVGYWLTPTYKLDLGATVDVTSADLLHNHIYQSSYSAKGIYLQLNRLF